MGQNVSMPVFSAPMSGIKSNLKGLIEEMKLLTDLFSGCKIAGTLGMGGDSFESTVNYVIPELIETIGGIGVCKPRTYELLKQRILQLAQAGAPVIGIDLDGIARMLINTNEVGRKSVTELKDLRALFSGPMFLKGILSVEDAILAYKTGYDGIIISNHGGRTIDYCLGTADILPQITKELKGKIQILVDGGVKSGYDIFIYLALGADAVLAGRTLLYSAIGGGKDGVALTLSKMEAQLKATMLYAGCQTIADITSDNIGLYES
jgi:4-hydroxymandelate oxidase